MKFVNERRFTEIVNDGFLSDNWLISANELPKPGRIMLKYHGDGNISVDTIPDEIEKLYIILSHDTINITLTDVTILKQLCDVDCIIKLDDVNSGKTYRLDDQFDKKMLDRYFGNYEKMTFTNGISGEQYYLEDLEALSICLCQNGQIKVHFNDQAKTVNKIAFRESQCYDQALDVIVINDDSQIIEGDYVVDNVYDGIIIHAPVLYAALVRQAIVCNSGIDNKMYGLISYIMISDDGCTYSDAMKNRGSSAMEYNRTYFRY